MLLQEVREEIARAGAELTRRGLAPAGMGNLSRYVPEAKVLVISPEGRDPDALSAGDVAVLTMDGVRLDGAARPSLEAPLHRLFYRREGVGAVVHTHSPFATLMACLGLPLEPIHPAIAWAGAERVPCIPYAPAGSEELSAAVEAQLEQGRALLLGNHGLVCLGPDLPTALTAAEELEFLARLCYYAHLAGGGRPLPAAGLDALLREKEGGSLC